MQSYRREFLRFLAASPLARLTANDKPKLDDILSIMDLDEAAKAVLPPAHYGYMASGVDDDVTLRANREGFQKITVRPRRLVDIHKVDTRVELFGKQWSMPVFLSPCGSQKAFHPDGEVAAAHAAKAKSTLQILSSITTCDIEAVTEAAGGTIWYQLYPTSRWEITQNLVRHAEAAGCPVIALTVDRPAPRNSETQKRMARLDSRQCASCHPPGTFYDRKPMFKGIRMDGVSQNNPAMNWEFVQRLRDFTKAKLLLKGIEIREDAELAVKAGIDGIIVSNHGGRAEDSGRATIHSLPEVVEAVNGRMPVLVDGGFRRGSDVFKALALGAKAVCVGRPYLWGMSAFGQAGVERALDIFRAELETFMGQCGTPTLASITRSSVEVSRS
jgi:isopentenyl diphosphate isomerase/L-lactate dehydrogenase-like FMN-dependent dehydrogenase